MSKMKLNFVLALACAALWTACQSTPPTSQPEVRQPSESKGASYTIQGRVGLSVSKSNAGDDDLDGHNAYFTVQVDCNTDRVLDRTEQGRIVRIDAKTVSEKQRRAYANFKKRSERQNRDANARPYLKISLTSLGSVHPCSGPSGIGQVFAGTNPTFSSAPQAKR